MKVIIGKREKQEQQLKEAQEHNKNLYEYEVVYKTVAGEEVPVKVYTRKKRITSC